MTNSVDGYSAVQWSRRERSARFMAPPESFLKVVPPKGAAKTGVKKHRCVLIAVFLSPPSVSISRLQVGEEIFLLLSPQLRAVQISGHQSVEISLLSDGVVARVNGVPCDAATEHPRHSVCFASMSREHDSSSVARGDPLLRDLGARLGIARANGPKLAK